MDTDVLIVGAGPTGMTLASELLLADVSTVLVDRLPERSTLSKAGGVQSRTLACLDERGLLEPLLASGAFPATTSHFAGLSLPLVLDRLPWRSVPQVDMERFLEGHLTAQGLRVQRDRELVGLDQDTAGVTATFADGTGVRARFLVGADGGHSTVRSLLGAEFPGRPGTVTVVAADVRLAGDEHIGTHTWSATGDWAEIFPLGTDPEGRPLRRLAIGGPGRALPRDTPVTEDELRDGLRAVYGDRVRLLEVRYARRITNAARQASHYRHGRVFLAGDAAHVHLPLGAQGMNTGMQDAFNLGWKLAAAVHGWGSDTLLDSYHTERHAVGAAVLRNVQAQSLLMDWEGRHDPDVLAVKEIFTEMVQLPAVQYFLAEMLSGAAIRYPIPGTGTHPLIGRHCPDTDLGSTHVRELLRGGHGVLLDPNGEHAELAAHWASRVDVAGTGTGTHTEAMLIRPDGYVCWAGDTALLEPALQLWFGDPEHR